ncbi:TetR family transcriptional regulator [Mycolicibacterium sp. XJ1819]
MARSQQTLGLRGRKKARTRDTIRREAIRLITDNGWANTTIDQIAEAAEIAPSTFFRYFPTKEAVLLADDLEHVMVEALAAQPRQLPALQAFRRAIEITAATVSKKGWELERARQRIVFSIPELKAAQFDTYRRSIWKLAEAENHRLGRRLDDFAARTFYGAVVGALMVVIDRTKGSVEDDMLRALDFIEAGMPL